jgi:crotonobetainyl-CoA:carnitine CoA-transferase CaiB-like acyl-CoA transferase
LLKLTIVNSSKDWQPFCHAISRPDFLEDERFNSETGRVENMSELIQEISIVFASQDFAYWQQKLEAHDIPHSKVVTYEEAADDPQKAANDIVIPLDHPVHGKMRTINSPIWVSGFEKREPHAAPQLGEHTEEVLEDLGYSDKEVRQILDSYRDE